MIATLARSSLMHMLGAFVAMGSWSYFANSGHPMPAPLIAALLQGTISACITFVLKSTIEYLNARFEGMAALLLPPLIAFCLSSSLLFLLHTLGGTPEILKTILLPLTVATGYAAIYNTSLWKIRKS